MTGYDIRVRNRDDALVRVAEDQFLLAGLEAAGLRLPYGCRFGACLTCAAYLVDGAVDRAGGRSFALSRQHEQDGYVLLCVSRPRADCVIDVGTRRDMYVNPFKRRRHSEPPGSTNPGR